MPGQLTDARTDVFYSDGKTVKKVWWIYTPSDRVRGPFLFAKRNEPKALKGQQWYVRDCNPASYTTNAAGALTAIGQIDYPVNTQADAVALAEKMYADLLATPKIAKLSKVNREAEVAKWTAAAIARVATNGTAR